MKGTWEMAMLFVASFHGMEDHQDVEELSPGIFVEKSAEESRRLLDVRPI